MRHTRSRLPSCSEALAWTFIGEQLSERCIEARRNGISTSGDEVDQKTGGRLDRSYYSTPRFWERLNGQALPACASFGMESISLLRVASPELQD